MKNQANINLNRLQMKNKQLTLVVLFIAIAAVMQQPIQDASTKSYKLSDAIKLLTKNKVLLSTTLMYFSINIGMGISTVWLPIFADEILGGGSDLLQSWTAEARTELATAMKDVPNRGKIVGFISSMRGRVQALVLYGASVPPENPIRLHILA